MKCDQRLSEIVNFQHNTKTSNLYTLMLGFYRYARKLGKQKMGRRLTFKYYREVISSNEELF